MPFSNEIYLTAMACISLRAITKTINKNADFSIIEMLENVIIFSTHSSKTVFSV